MMRLLSNSTNSTCSNEFDSENIDVEVSTIHHPTPIDQQLRCANVVMLHRKMVLLKVLQSSVVVVVVVDTAFVVVAVAGTVVRTAAGTAEVENDDSAAAGTAEVENDDSAAAEVETKYSRAFPCPDQNRQRSPEIQ